MGKPARMYKLTDGQAAALVVAQQAGGTVMVARLWAVLEHLFVSREDWDRFDQAIVSGELELKDALRFISSVASYDWDSALSVIQGDSMTHPRPATGMVNNLPEDVPGEYVDGFSADQ